MKKLLLLSALFLFGISSHGGATAVSYNYTASVSLYDFGFELYTSSGSGFTPEPVDINFDHLFSGANAWLSDNEGNEIVNLWNETGISESGPGYEITASAPSDFELLASIGVNGGNSGAGYGQASDFYSPGDGLLKISFSYDVAIPDTPFNSAQVYVSVSDPSTSNVMYSFSDDIWDHGIDANKQGVLFIPVMADQYYFLDAYVNVAMDTDMPLHTPLPNAALLLGCGILGLARFSRRSA